MTAKVRPLFGDTQPLDRRARPLPIPPSEHALRAAAAAGWDDGERAGYVTGWRYGVLCGLLAGVLLGGLGIAAAIHLGMLFGAPA